MMTADLWRFNIERPKLSLTLYFTAWKALLLFIALSSPSPAYDTSTGLALGDLSIDLRAPYQGSSILEKLTRWDAIYFVQIAHSGYTYEQQWMAGWGFTKLLGLLSHWITSLSSTSHIAAIGIAVAHTSHLLSTLVLYELSLLALTGLTKPKRSSMALLAACLHIISPAGLFLSAPYAESLFSLTTFLGFYLYAKSLLRQSEKPELSRLFFLLSSGLCLGATCMIRGNGLLSGLIYVHELVMHIRTFALKGFPYDIAIFRRLCVLVLTGMMMGGIAVFPQYLAYVEYCKPIAKRSWCLTTFPSIYAWIQSNYWNVGFLHYWTFSNLPLFILAMPMLYIMQSSGIWAWQHTTRSRLQYRSKVDEKDAGSITDKHQSSLMTEDEILQTLAVPQMVLAVLALTTYHVQIITRLSSAYPVWYWWLAHMVIENGGESVVFRHRMKSGMLVIRWMIIYAIVQGGLFASFLPPA